MATMCDRCKSEEAVYDAPCKALNGSWANVCVPCAKEWGANLTIGCKIKKHPAQQPEQGRTVDGEEAGGPDDLEYWESITYNDADREITCPECGDTRTVEPDADYTYLCSCGVTVKVPENPYL